MRDSAFWAVIIWLMMVPSFTITGLFLPSDLYSGAKGCAVMALVFKLYLVCAGSCWKRIFSGFLIDKLTAHRVAYVSQIPLLFSCLFLWWGHGTYWLPVYFCSFWRRRRYDTTSNKCAFGRAVWHKLVGRN